MSLGPQAGGPPGALLSLLPRARDAGAHRPAPAGTRLWRGSCPPLQGEWAPEKPVGPVGRRPWTWASHPWGVRRGTSGTRDAGRTVTAAGALPAGRGGAGPSAQPPGSLREATRTHGSGRRGNGSGPAGETRAPDPSTAAPGVTTPRESGGTRDRRPGAYRTSWRPVAGPPGRKDCGGGRSYACSVARGRRLSSFSRLRQRA